jgi:sigma-54 dependent transcriptional regulator, acetoin dehydrogenase operon transcriptional activator AcoR
MVTRGTLALRSIEAGHTAAGDPQRPADDVQRRHLLAMKQSRLEVEESWRRCEALGLSRNGQFVPPYNAAAENMLGRVKRHARPVLDDLVNDIEGLVAAFFLVDPTGYIVDRRCSRPLENRFDRRYGARGYQWSEEHAGTTGLGIALETRRPAYVVGNEHYKLNGDGWADYAAPIRHPVTRRVIGVLDFACLAKDTGRYMMPLVRHAQRAIERELYQNMPPDEHAALLEFLHATSRWPRSGIAVLTEDVFITNPAAQALLSRYDVSLIQERASQTLAGDGNHLGTIPCTSGQTDLTVQYEAVGTRAPCVLMRMVETEIASQKAVVEFRAGQRPDVSQAPLIVVGEDGSGKLTEAQRLYGEDPDATSLVTIDALDTTAAGDFRNRVNAALGQPGAWVLLAHAEQLDDDLARAVLRRLTEPIRCRRFVATVSSDEVARPCLFLQRIPDHIELAPLRERLDDIPALIEQLVAAQGGKVRLRPEVLRTLMRHEWPDNIRELSNVVAYAVARRRSGDITLADLPAAYRDGGRLRRLTTMERVERAAIRRALVQSDGNRTKAAERLQIGRATLYRKMKSYGLRENVGFLDTGDR